MPFLFIEEFRREINRILIVKAFRSLHEGFIFLIEAVVHHIVLKETAHHTPPNSRHTKPAVVVAIYSIVQPRLTIHQFRKNRTAPMLRNIHI